MKLDSLATILKSTRGNVQFAILYERDTNADIATGSIDYIVSEYGSVDVEQITAFENQLIITI